MMRTLLAGLLLGACTVNYPVSPEGCPAACDRLRALECPAGEPTPEGDTCEDVCRNVQASGLNQINTTCIANAATCDAAEGCAP